MTSVPKHFRAQPDGIINADAEHMRLVVNKNTNLIFTAHATLDATAIKAPATGGGFAVISGQATVTGSQLGITTGLALVTQVIASISNGTTPTNSTVTARVTPGNTTQIDLFVWSPTSAVDNTPIASVVPTLIHYWATGTSSV